MSDLLILILVVTIGSLLSLIGGIYLLYGRWGTHRIQRVAVPFAAGALLAAAFLDLLPEAIASTDPSQVGLIVLLGFIAFFVLERSLGWFHHHHEDEKGGNKKSTSSLIIIGDTAHNFIDGLAIGAAFIVSPAVGVVTTIAVAAHELPQEIGDFGLLASKGMKKRTILWVNVASSFATLLGALIVYSLGDVLSNVEGILLAATAGFFIYIAASDIIPTIHAEPKRVVANMQTAVLLFGIVFVGVFSNLAGSFIHEDDEPSGNSGQLNTNSYVASNSHLHDENEHLHLRIADSSVYLI